MKNKTSLLWGQFPIGSRGGEKEKRGRDKTNKQGNPIYRRTKLVARHLRVFLWPVRKHARLSERKPKGQDSRTRLVTRPTIQLCVPFSPFFHFPLLPPLPLHSPNPTLSHFQTNQPPTSRRTNTKKTCLLIKLTSATNFTGLCGQAQLLHSIARKDSPQAPIDPRRSKP